MLDANYQKLIYGALLHDIGKLVQRANPGEGNHSERGADFASRVFGDPDWQEVRACIRYHHADALRAANLKSNSLAYIVYEADNIAAGADRRSSEATEEQRLFRKIRPDIAGL